MLPRFDAQGGAACPCFGSVTPSVAMADRDPVPSKLLDEVAPVGFPGVRAWGDALPQMANAIREGREEKIKELYEAEGRPAEGLDLHFLALSGGASYGAYSAGLLCGWTQSGERPNFQVVTGVSVGALIAPFAFLGPDRDDDLRSAFQDLSTRSLAEPRIFDALLGSPSVFDPEPLRETIEGLFDADLLAAVADEWRRGRELLVGTTHLDAGRLMVWNMGALAAQGSDEALALFRRVILASSSIPGAYPPVHFEVAVPSEPKARWEELHADGSVANVVFAYPYQVSVDVAHAIPAPCRRHLHVVLNDFGRSPYVPVPEKLSEILRSSIRIQCHRQGRGDLSRLASAAERDGVEFRLACIPEDFDHLPTSEFDPEFMRDLFERAEKDIQHSSPWRSSLP